MSVKRIVAILLAMALALSLTAALGEEKAGFFGQLAEDEYGDSRVTALAALAQDLNLEWTNDEGARIELGQALYEGNRVFVAFRLSGRRADTVLHEGAPEQELEWISENEGPAVDAYYFEDEERVELAQQLDGKGQRWLACRDVTLEDALYLTDGTFVGMDGGESINQDDHVTLGWEIFEVPEEFAQDTLTFSAQVLETSTVFYQDGPVCRYAYLGESRHPLTFTLTRQQPASQLTSSYADDTFALEARLDVGQVELSGQLALTCPPAWLKAWDEWDFASCPEVIRDWDLYQNGVKLEIPASKSILLRDDQLLFKAHFALPESLEGLSLVPLRGEEGLPDETKAIPLTLQAP